MKHAVAGYKLGRKTNHRRAMFRNMAVSLFTHKQITTTLPKAKALQPYVEKLITLARKGGLASRRRVIQRLGDPIMIAAESDLEDDRYTFDNRGEKLIDGPRVVKELFDNIAPKYADRPGGFTRIIKLDSYRIGDGADLVVLQLVETDDSRPKPKPTSKRRRIADKRTAFAAKLRKGGTAEAATEEAPAAETEAPADDEAAEDQADAPEAQAEAPAEAEAPAADAATAEGDEEEKS